MSRPSSRRLDSIGSAIVDFAIQRPRLIIVSALVIAVVLGALIVRVQIDTDPENMLPGNDPVRVLNDSIRDDFGTRNVIALGIVDEGGVLTPETIGAASLLIDDVSAIDGVVGEQVVSFKSATEVPPGALSSSDVEGIAAAVNENALFAGRVIASDAQTLAIFVPLESKGNANGVSSSIGSLIDESSLPATSETYIAGLPVAEEAFGRDMFIQMGILAPLAGLLIFLLMLFFFRRLSLVIPAMAVAMLSVIWTMGLMIGTGFTVHIMASMIPIFLMPIAILDSIHVLSEFFDRYPRYRDKRETLRAVYKELFVPITYTTLTTAVAFAFLALAPIPPVRVFGIFVAFGVLSAWVLTMLFIPAFIMLLDEEGLARVTTKNAGWSTRVLDRGLHWLGRAAIGGGRFILPVFILLAAVSVLGITRINVNDNPVNWFKPGSDVRQSTEVLNDHLPGVYNASLVVNAEAPATLTDPAVAAAVVGLQDHIADNDFVGQTTSYVDAVTTENYLANDRDETFRTIPGDQTAIETSLASAAATPELAAIGSLITTDYQRANIQVLMNSGNNTAMQSVIDDAESYFVGQALPAGVTAEWAGETYLNLVWQDKMVSGMLKAFLSTFLVVFALMVLLFRSLRWAVLAMVPMSVTILLVYGTVGLVGKDYDMPLAVLSTLVLGIGVDFAIHFVQRYRELADKLGDSRKALEAFFDEPARALTRNALIIAVGFVPMFFATLMPYIYVGIHLASVMLLSWLATLLLLPALITLLPFDDRTKESAPPNLEPSGEGVLD